MKTRLLSFFALFVLLLVSTAVLADGRPTGIRIGRLVSGGGANVELDVTVTGTNRFYSDSWWDSASTTVWLAAEAYGPFQSNGWQVTPSRSSPLPWAIDWGDSYAFSAVPLFGASGGPFQGTFSHTYTSPGVYMVTVGDFYGPDPETMTKRQKGIVPYTGNAITSSNRYISANQTFNDSVTTWSYGSPQLIAITANATVTTGTGIPALNIYGLLAMAFVLVGAGLLVFRRPQNSAI